MKIQKLASDDYLNQNYDFWKNYRLDLIKEVESEIKEEEEEPLEKTPENIVYLSNKIGVKPTARYFNILPSTVRYYKKKIETK